MHLAKLHHPDSKRYESEKSSEKFKEISAAFDFLKEYFKHRERIDLGCELEHEDLAF